MKKQNYYTFSNKPSERIPTVAKLVIFCETIFVWLIVFVTQYSRLSDDVHDFFAGEIHETLMQSGHRSVVVCMLLIGMVLWAKTNWYAFSKYRVSKDGIHIITPLVREETVYRWSNMAQIDICRLTGGIYQNVLAIRYCSYSCPKAFKDEYMDFFEAKKIREKICIVLYTAERLEEFQSYSPVLITCKNPKWLNPKKHWWE